MPQRGKIPSLLVSKGIDIKCLNVEWMPGEELIWVERNIPLERQSMQPVFI